MVLSEVNEIPIYRTLTKHIVGNAYMHSETLKCAPHLRFLHYGSNISAPYDNIRTDILEIAERKAPEAAAFGALLLWRRKDHGQKKNVQ